MTAVYVQDGDSIDYAPSADVAAGAVVVQGDLIGIAKRPIAANQLGALAVSGVFDITKATGTSTAINAGANIYWNATTQVATTTASGNKLLGKTIKAATDADATVRVRLMQ